MECDLHKDCIHDVMLTLLHFFVGSTDLDIVVSSNPSKDLVVWKYVFIQ